MVYKIVLLNQTTFMVYTFVRENFIRHKNRMLCLVIVQTVLRILGGHSTLVVLKHVSMVKNCTNRDDFMVMYVILGNQIDSFYGIIKCTGIGAKDGYTSMKMNKLMFN